MPLICSVTCNESEKSYIDLIYVCKIYKVKICHTLPRFLKINLFAVLFLNVDRFYNYCSIVLPVDSPGLPVECIGLFGKMEIEPQSSLWIHNGSDL